MLIALDDHPQLVDAVLKEPGQRSLQLIALVLQAGQQPAGLAANLLALGPEVIGDLSLAVRLLIELEQEKHRFHYTAYMPYCQ